MGKGAHSWEHREPSGHRTHEGVRGRVLELSKEVYEKFNDTNFAEMLASGKELF